jgi:Flp pilus assembly protein TadG
MFEFARNKLSVQMKRITPLVAIRRFVRREDGSSAVEFGLILLPFIAMMFAIMETALVFFAQQTLETAVADSARLIMTGQAQNGAWQPADFKQRVCARIYGLFTCDSSAFVSSSTSPNVYVNVQTYSSFGGITYTPPLDRNGNLDSSGFGYNTGGPGNIVVVQLFYQWPIFVSLMNLGSLSNMAAHSRLLVATAAFRNEPYN